MVADPAADCRERVLLLDQLQRFPVFTLSNQGNVALDTDMGRASGLARAAAFLVDGIRSGHRLGIALVGGLAGGKALIEFIFQLNGTDGRAFPATRAFLPVDEAGMLQDGCLESPHLTVQSLELTQREQFNVRMAGTLDQFRRNDAHGAIVGGESLVQLRHDPANG